MKFVVSIYRDEDGMYIASAYRSRAALALVKGKQRRRPRLTSPMQSGSAWLHGEAQTPMPLSASTQHSGE